MFIPDYQLVQYIIFNPSIIVKFTVHLLHEMESNTINNNMYMEGMSGTHV